MSDYDALETGEARCERGNILSHLWKRWTLHFNKCVGCGETIPLEQYRIARVRADIEKMDGGRYHA